MPLLNYAPDFYVHVFSSRIFFTTDLSSHILLRICYFPLLFTIVVIRWFSLLLLSPLLFICFDCTTYDPFHVHVHAHELSSQYCSCSPDATIFLNFHDLNHHEIDLIFIFARLLRDFTKSSCSGSSSFCFFNLLSDPLRFSFSCIGRRRECFPAVVLYDFEKEIK
ncbi:hypothetical protein DFH05DRAFT_191501 [Lentinula detonsa]|uniref:Uncharacterized protein n=1 Tax=Lentinula detonsa TaxID=2804962 RepID=A0A9W8PCK4_9AGAR|nr:hypothetical protein DFH05DRAFT_191501 [Lentinula detonsa]